MNGEETVPETRTITWIDERGRVVSLEVPADAAERIGFYTDEEPMRQTKDEAIAALDDELAVVRARKAQVEAELDTLVTLHPELKSAPRRRPSDDAA